MSVSRSFLDEVLAAHLGLARRVGDELGDEVLEAAARTAAAIRLGGKVLVCGNGGSAADAQHFAAELVGRFGREGAALPAIALTVDSSVLTALGNDVGFSEVFARQIEAIGRSGDVLFAITTSGRSANVLRAVEVARRLGLEVVALTGDGGRDALGDVDSGLFVPSSDTQRIQEMHSLILHLIGEIVVREAG